MVDGVEESERVPLGQVAPALGGYSRAWGLVMAGKLDAVQRGRFWYVSLESAAKLAAAQSAA